ncbi:hypothetical protein GCM10017562_10080 [Streptomyces roseofulvus]
MVVLAGVSVVGGAGFFRGPEVLPRRALLPGAQPQHFSRPYAVSSASTPGWAASVMSVTPVSV